MKTEMVRLDRITHMVDGNPVLNNMSLHIFAGEIMGLICINSYGLDAFLQLLRQNVPIHYGHVYFEEKLVNSYRRSSMKPNRVSVIEKRGSLVADLTVADNIFVLRKGFKKYLIRPKVIERQLNLFAGELQVPIPAHALVSELTSFEKCVVELLKALVTGVRLVVLQDISNFVGAADLVKFHELVRHCTALGMCFLYICSHHEEVFQVCDRTALMENGKILKVLDRVNFKNEMIPGFSAIQVSDTAPPAALPYDRNDARRKHVLELRHIVTDHMEDVSLTVKEGECIVVYDINNTTLDDFIGLMTGDIAPLRGEVRVDRVVCRGNHIETLQNHVSIISENPTQSMVFPEMSYFDNLCFQMDRRYPMMWANRRVRKGIFQEYESFIGRDIFADDVTSLSKTSLYNLIYYRVHLFHPKVVFCVQPFAGADMYLRYHVLWLMQELQSRGIAVVILAVSLADSLAVADRLLTIENGRLVRECSREGFDTFGRLGQI